MTLHSSACSFVIPSLISVQEDSLAVSANPSPSAIARKESKAGRARGACFLVTRRFADLQTDDCCHDSWRLSSMCVDGLYGDESPSNAAMTAKLKHAPHLML
uniref:Uncharacterized protein n=1 Tax=Hanusia phi TaxID=3032 RepID=A0A7S0E3U9_9CRYP